MIRLKSYVCDRWEAGDGPLRDLIDPSTEAVIAQTTTGGIAFDAALAHARDVGGPALRALTFAERGALLKAMARALHAHRDDLLALSTRCNGTTRGDGKFDVDGATGTLAAYARIGRALGESRLRLDGEAEKLGGGARYVGQHVWLPRPGAAVHVNAFNFPAWGTFEKVAQAILAGMPVVSKPATATAALAFRMVELIVEAGVLPAGALSFVAGPAGDLLTHLGPQDCLAFTGSADTAAVLRSGPGVRERSARINVEADSLNAAVLGPDVEVGDDLWHLFVRNVVKDMTQKTGQKCTAIRRVMVPQAQVDDALEALAAELALFRVGNPADTSVTMGPVASAAQLRDTRAGIDELGQEARIVCGGSRPLQGLSAPDGKGYFVAPTLLKGSADSERVHSREVFGPCATVLPYDGDAESGAGLVARGQGSLVSSVYSDDRRWLADFLMSAAPWNGRVLAASKKVSDQTFPPGMVLPNQVHGGPGRAGGGEELGGLRGLNFYSNRVAIQGDAGVLRKILS